MKRRKMGAHESRAHFSGNATQTHAYNMPRRQPMRGGIRL